MSEARKRRYWLRWKRYIARYNDGVKPTAAVMRAWWAPRDRKHNRRLGDFTKIRTDGLP